MAPSSISASRDDDHPGLDRPVIDRSGHNGGRPPPRRGGDGGGSSLVPNLILMLVVAGLGIGGWFVMNQQKLLSSAQSDQQAAEARLKVLEDRLRATDEVMTDAGADTKEKLGYWESEIRKVWDVAYKVNRGWIKENQALLAKHKEELEEIATGIAAVKGDLSAQGTGLDDLTERLQELDDLTAKVEGVTAGQDKLAKNIADIDTRALTERVIRNEQAVSAIDAYRVQLNRRLTELQGRVDAMGPVAGSP
mgnify:CR=1 FL=1